MSLNYIKNFYEGCVSKTMCPFHVYFIFSDVSLFLWQNPEITLYYTVKSDADLT